MILDNSVPATRMCRVLSLIFAMAMSARVMGFIPWSVSNIAFYTALFISTAAMLRYIGQLDYLTMTFMLYIPLAIIISGPDAVFRPWLRYGLFAMLLLVVSPFVKSESAIVFRWNVMRWILLISIALGIGSFVAYFVGINYMRNVWDGSGLYAYQGSAGLFSGLVNHSMMLAPICGVATLASVYLAMTRKDKKFWVLAVVCFGTLLFSASRVSLLATICGGLALIYFFSAHKSIMVRRITGIMLLAVISYPLWSGATEGITKKNQGDITSGINTDSRSPKWEYRIEEWKDSPIFGIGFAAVSSRDDIGFKGVVEPGSSWLALLSMTGIIGFGLFLAIFIRAIKRTLLTNTPMGALLGGILVLLGVHMLAEGYVYAAGGYLCFMLWLTLGCATYYNPEEEQENYATE